MKPVTEAYLNYLKDPAMAAQLFEHAYRANRLLPKDGTEGLTEYLVATVPSATAAEGAVIYVSNETGGAVLAFSDGTNWRRVTDRAIVS